MKNLKQAAAVIALGAACAMPVFAQDNSASTTANTANTQSTATQGPATQTMGAGPEDLNRNDRNHDYGWIGLLGLAGLLGLRRKHDDYDRGNYNRTTTAR